MREAKDRGVLIPISGSPLVALLEGANLRVWRKLHHAEWHRRPRECMTVRPCTDQRVDQGQFGLPRKMLLSNRNRGMTEEQESECDGSSIELAADGTPCEGCHEHASMIVGS